VRPGIFAANASSAGHWRYIAYFTQDHTMAKGDQRSNKMTKKPKKDNSPPTTPATPAGTFERITPPTTVVMPKGKLKNK
jgi:hypothetical protein